MRLIALSDTHCQLAKVQIPEGDILIHAGDFSYRGSLTEVNRELNVLASFKHRFKHIVLIPGNHDFIFEQQPALMKQICTDLGLTCLIHEPATLEGINFFGSGYTPFFHNWAFNVQRGADLAKKWSEIPMETQVLITHGPVMGILDYVITSCEHVGCEDLSKRVMVVKPQYHICGHIHCEYGTVKHGATTYINASTCNEDYEIINPAIEFEI